MRTGRPKEQLELSAGERTQLESFVRSCSLPAALAVRARIVLHSAGGQENESIATRLERAGPCARWQPRRASPRAAFSATFNCLALSPTAVRASSCQPTRSSWRLRDVVGLYLSPPDNALTICVGEKSRCQSLESMLPMLPMLPMGFGYIEGVSHDYKSHGTAALSAALNVLNGAVLPVASRAIDTRSAYRPCARSTRRCQPRWTFIASWTATPRTAIRKSSLG